MSACLRLSASFISTLMALRLRNTAAVVYRTKVTCVSVVKIIGCGILSAAFVAAWPAIGWGRVKAYRGLCSFDLEELSLSLLPY